MDPALLCLDEPFSALDVLSAETLRGELLELWIGTAIATRAILLVSHNIEEAVLMADRIVVMDKEPGRIIAELPVCLAHPRDRKAPAYVALVDRVYALLMGQTQPEQLEFGTEPGEAGLTRSLPQTSIGALSGLLDYVNDVPNRPVDLYQLRSDLRLDLNELTPAVEAAELLGFATVAASDLTLTPLGETFAEASILTRKELFATRLRRLPLFRWMLRMLHASSRGSLSWDVFAAALEVEVPPGDAERQLNTALEWGRYAEIFAYSDAEGRF